MALRITKAELNGDPKKMKFSSRRIVISLLVIGTVHIFLDTLESDLTRRLQGGEGQNVVHQNMCFGSHFVTLHVGNPPQKQRLMIDTGSDHTAFRCHGCSDCGNNHVSTPFNFSKSSAINTCPGQCAAPEATCEDGSEHCHVSINCDPYADLSGGYKAIETQDRVYIDSRNGPDETYDAQMAKKHGFALDFLCQRRVHGSLRESFADGTMGISNAPSSFLNQMNRRGQLQKRIVSLCFNDFGQYVAKGTSAGSVVLGDFDRAQHTTPLVWASNVAADDTPGSFALMLRNIFLGNGGDQSHALRQAVEGTMSVVPIESFDSNHVTPTRSQSISLLQTNNPESQLNEIFKSAFLQAFKTATGLEYNPDGILLPSTGLGLFPTIFLQFEVRKVIVLSFSGCRADIWVVTGTRDTRRCCTNSARLCRFQRSKSSL